MRRIVWTVEAVSNLESIFAYVSAFNASAAVRLARRLQSAADSLATHPDRGRETRSGLRELTIIHPYLIRYRVRDDAILILRIRHGAQDAET
ncbi:type II toxin-antitoxin system RelE/ParE family toxin [Caulobacter henricii]|uniref:type II toxin-antitoxin system RelE/ParE family toxin n=1 Tax=Caulobacter henricii TaxID=69395 RepID=UPI0009FEB443|nr:type II toxin-antitoxin system RelE/ParE family toxin [Caulobacter henricii]